MPLHPDEGTPLDPRPGFGPVTTTGQPPPPGAADSRRKEDRVTPDQPAAAKEVPDRLRFPEGQA